MKSSTKWKAVLGRGGLVALVVALCAQVAGAEASIIGPGGRALGPNSIQHAVQTPPRKSGPITGAGRRLTVTTTADGGTGGSLRQRIAEARPGDTVVVPAGTYVLTEGELEIDKALTIAGAGAAQTTIDGGGNTRGILIQVPFASNTPVTISGLTITHTSARLRDPGFETFDGAAIASANADLTLRNDAITRNVVKPPAGEGLVFGGVVLENLGRFTMVGTTVSENLVSATGESFIAGGIVGAEGTESTIVENSKIVANRVEARAGAFNLIVGGGMRIVGFGPAQVTGSTISGNVAQADSGEVVGGGLHVVGEPTRIIADRMSGNVADAGTGTAQGGGLSFSGIGGITGSVFEANRVAGGVGLGGNLAAEPGFFLEEDEVTVSHTSVLHGLGPSGSENCATTQEETIRSLGFNSESTDQCGFHAEGDMVNIG